MCKRIPLFLAFCYNVKYFGKNIVAEPNPRFDKEGVIQERTWRPQNHLIKAHTCGIASKLVLKWDARERVAKLKRQNPSLMWFFAVSHKKKMLSWIRNNCLNSLNRYSLASVFTSGNNPFNDDGISTCHSIFTKTAIGSCITVEWVYYDTIYFEVQIDWYIILLYHGLVFKFYSFPQ